MARTRLEISIAFKDKGGVTRYRNGIGNVWLDLETMKGSIELPPGTALVSVAGQADTYLNISPPFERDAGQQRGGGGGRGNSRNRDDDSEVF